LKSWDGYEVNFCGVLFEFQVLLSRVSFFASQGSDVAQDDVLGMYKQTADAVMCILLPDSETAAFRTEGKYSQDSEVKIKKAISGSPFV
jgi:hypothetical protein